MKQYLLVFLGGGLGSICRFVINKFMQNWQPVFPFATATVNFLSCLVLGFFLVVALEKTQLNAGIKLLIITGFCGGLSTYSTFTYETVELFKTSQTGLAISNIIINFAISVTGLYLGFLIAKLFL